VCCEVRLFCSGVCCVVVLLRLALLLIWHKSAPAFI
jgi:hypothetical protein